MVQALSALFERGVLALAADGQECGEPSRPETLGSDADEPEMRQQQAETGPLATSAVSEFCPEPSGPSRPARNQVAGVVA